MEKGVPNTRVMRDNCVSKIDSRILPTPNEAAELYRANGGTLTDLSEYGSDPGANDPNKSSIHERHFLEKYNLRSLLMN